MSRPTRNETRWCLTHNAAFSTNRVGVCDWSQHDWCQRILKATQEGKHLTMMESVEGVEECEPVQAVVLVPDTCPECDGDKLCRHCDGYGNYEYMTGEGELTAEWRVDQCAECSSGGCPSCGGRGYVWPDNLIEAVSEFGQPEWDETKAFEWAKRLLDALVEVDDDESS